MVELDWLETFLAVADRGGFTAASEQVHRSQSRVSAHIALLERSLGVTLVDRTRRPSTLTPAGEVLVDHARAIVARVGSARSAVAALRGLDRRRVTVMTTPCIGACFLPAVLAALVHDHPGLFVELIEPAAHDPEGRHPAEGVVLKIMPVLDPPLAPGLREQRLWREGMRIVVHPDHRFVREAEAVPAWKLAYEPLIVCGPAIKGDPEIVRLLARRGVRARPIAVVNGPQALVALVRAGVGVGIMNAVAVGISDLAGVAVIDVDDPGLTREVAAYYYDAVASSDLARWLYDAVLAAAVPVGAEPITDGRPDGR